MCDYSLAGVENRLAQSGEELRTWDFPTHSTGFVSANDPALFNSNAHSPIGVYLCEVRRPVAVCILPGAQLRLSNIPWELQREHGISDTETVTFEQDLESQFHRDGVQFGNGKFVSLQVFSGYEIGAIVLSLGTGERQQVDESELQYELVRVRG